MNIEKSGRLQTSESYFQKVLGELKSMGSRSANGGVLFLNAAV